jgi:hypothetical protein
VNTLLLFLAIFAIYFLFAVGACFFGSMLTKEPLQLSEAIPAALLTAFLAAVPTTVLLRYPDFPYYWLRTRAYPALALFAILGLLVKKIRLRCVAEYPDDRCGAPAAKPDSLLAPGRTGVKRALGSGTRPRMRGGDVDEKGVERRFRGQE